MGIYIKGLDFYPAMVRREGESFQADFVDIPECRAYGRSVREVELNARQALGAHMATLGRYGRSLPLPSVVSDQARGGNRYLIYVEGPERLKAA